MKIDIYKDETSFAPNVKNISRNRGGSEYFHQLFEAVLNQSGNEQGFDGITPSISYPKVSAVFPLKAGNADPMVLLNHVEDLLDKLEEYRVKLKDQKMLPEQVGPVVNSLIKAKERLVLRAYHLAENSILKEIVGQAVDVANREINDYKNGHYLPFLT